MIKKLIFIALGCLAIAGSAQANRGNVDVVVPMPPEVWGSATGGSNNQPCNRCCVYQNDRYSEGAVVKIEGELLQCTRDPQLLSTNDLVWKRLKK